MPLILECVVHMKLHQKHQKHYVKPSINSGHVCDVGYAGRYILCSHLKLFRIYKLCSGHFSIVTGQKERGKPRCKFQGKTFDLGKIIDTKTAEDGCTKAILQCRKVGRKAKIILEAKSECQCPNVATELKKLESLIELHMEKTGNI